MFKSHNKKHKKYYGFTLVELIIVITILAILATISFVSFSGYTSKSRDSNRLFSLKEISKALEIQKEMTGNYPQPDEIYANGGIPNLDETLFSVGLIGKNVSNYVKLGSIPLDPKTGNEYLYGLSRDNKNFQIAGTLENLQSSMIIPVTYADNGMQAVVEGNYKGVIKFSTGSSNYIGNIPSLIFSRSGTYNELRTFVINKGKNLPYSVDGEKLGTGLTPSEVLKELHNKDSLTLTGVVINNPKSEDEIKDISQNLGVPDLIVAETLGNKEYVEKYADKGGSSGGGGTPTTPTITCPEGYILVPGNSTFSTSDFCVMKYEAKINGNDDGNTTYNSSFMAESRLSGTPWVRIRQTNAITACNNLGAGYHLITNNEWMTIARNIETNPQNWADGNIGSLVSNGGGLFRGNVNLNDSASCGSNSVLDGNTPGTNCEVNGRNKRTHTLSNGEVIWDLAGNVREYVNGTNNISSTDGVVTNGDACGDTAWHSWNSVNDGYTSCTFTNTGTTSYSKANYGPSGDYNANNGVGRILSSTSTNRVFIRGAYWSTADSAGVFSLHLASDPLNASTPVGFRCVFSVN